MKRINNLHPQVCNIRNIEIADCRAREHKTKKYGIIKHDMNHEKENRELQRKFSNLTYKTSEYSTFKIYEPKERIIFRLPYYPDRIAHHSIMNITEDIWVKIFIKQTYSCIKNRGIHALLKDLSSDLKKYPEQTIYCLKMDIKKFYPSLNHDVLKKIIRKKIKDKYLLVLLDEIIDSAPGVPIGNYLSQFFANLYLTYFDHWLKEECHCRFYYRYADDIVILSDSKEFLHNILCAIKIYIHQVLKIEIKPTYQIFPVDSRGIDFVGYVFRHDYIRLRKSIKQNIKKLVDKFWKNKISREKLVHSLASYKGWLKYCDSRRFANLVEERAQYRISNWKGEELSISQIYRKTLHIVECVVHHKYLEIHCIYKGIPRTIKTGDISLLYQMGAHARNTGQGFPMNFKIYPYVRRKKNRVNNSTSENTEAE